jgi:hypothetical protein
VEERYILSMYRIKIYDTDDENRYGGPGMMAHAYNPSFWGYRGRRPTQAKLARSYHKNKIQKQGMGHSSSGGALAS